MKEDITQLQPAARAREAGCGLVMKEDITQQRVIVQHHQIRCGLVMKEDITQQERPFFSDCNVVVW